MSANNRIGALYLDTRQPNLRKIIHNKKSLAYIGSSLSYPNIAPLESTVSQATYLTFIRPIKVYDICFNWRDIPPSILLFTVYPKQNTLMHLCFI